MATEYKDHEPSLDDIFSRLRKEEKGKRKVVDVPFKFLDSYTIEDKNIFFGRDNETDEIFRKLYSGKLLLVYGKSGTGKSSIINCGLISRIPQEDIYPINIRCGKKANDNFISEIKKYSNAKYDNPLEILEDIFYEHSKPIALIFDQFEEIFILSDDEEREKLAKGLNEILKSRLKINIILIIREEYFANLTEFEAIIPGLYENRTRIERMNKSAAKEAIIKPCKTCSVGIEDGLADKIIEHLTGQTEGLELTWLQILMDRLYRTAAELDSQNPVIKLQDLEKLGRIGNVLSDFLDEQLRLMPHGDLGEAILKTMISADGTKKLVNINDISDTLKTTGHAVNQSLIEEILRHLIKVRIVTDKDEQGYYELRHDAIAGRIYERMTAVERELIEVKAFLDNSYKTYIQRSVLLTDNDLQYIALYESKLILSNELKDFIKISKKNVQHARHRRRNIVVAATIALIVVLSGFTIWAMNERTNAIKLKTIAEEQKNEAIKANKEAESARIRAQEGENKAKANEAMAIEQEKIANAQRQAAIRANSEAENSRRQALDEKNRAVENEKSALSAKREAENARNDVIKASSQAQFYLYLFNGKELANKSLTMQEDDILRTLLALSAFDLVTYSYKNFNPDQAPVKYDGEILKALQNAFSLFESDSITGGEIWSVASKNNKTVYSNKIGQLIVAKLENRDPGKLPVLSTETTINLPVNSLVRALTFDPGSNRLACGTIDGSVMLFESFDTHPYEVKVIYTHNNNRILNLAFVPGKDWLISSSTDKTIRVWDIARQKVVKDLRLNEPVQKFTLINSKHLIYANSAGQVLIWHLDDIDREPQIIYSGDQHQPFQTVAYNAEHKWLAATTSGTVMIFPVPDPENPGNLKPEQFTLRHKTVITQMGFSPDNNWLVTGSADALMLWDMRDAGTKEVNKFEPIKIDNSRQLFSLAFDENSRYIIYGDNRLMHMRPIDISDIYTRLKLKVGNKKLSDGEWKYYVKGDLVKPE
jgi:WD40 repeat protein